MILVTTLDLMKELNSYEPRSVTSYTAGTAGSLAGTITSGHAITLTAGGAGTSATGQFVTEITVID